MNKIYIVSSRYGAELNDPMVFTTKAEAEEKAKEIVYDAAFDDYDGDLDNPSFEELEEWAEENGYELYEYYYWDGSYDATEVLITEHEI